MKKDKKNKKDEKIKFVGFISADFGPFDRLIDVEKMATKPGKTIPVTYNVDSKHIIGAAISTVEDDAIKVSITFNDTKDAKRMIKIINESLNRLEDFSIVKKFKENNNA